MMIPERMIQEQYSSEKEYCKFTIPSEINQMFIFHFNADINNSVEFSGMYFIDKKELLDDLSNWFFSIACYKIIELSFSDSDRKIDLSSQEKKLEFLKQNQDHKVIFNSIYDDSFLLKTYEDVIYKNVSSVGRYYMCEFEPRGIYYMWEFRGHIYAEKEK